VPSVRRRGVAVAALLAVAACDPGTRSSTTGPAATVRTPAGSASSAPAAGASTLATRAPGSPSPAPPSAPREAAPSPAAASLSAASQPAADAGPAATVAPTADPNARATLAFGGDVHFEGSSRSGLSGELGSAFGRLRDADAGFVNLETAITDRGTPGPKAYTFRAPARALTVLKAAGVDAATVANNHGLDYGRVGFADTLAASRTVGLPLIGGGADQAAAFTPWRGTLNGIRVAVFGATDVLDSYAIDTWPATATRAGLAATKDQQPLLDAVRTERSRSDVVVVFVHWGTERVVCPTGRQQQLARDLAGAGASLVVGSHAHVVQPAREIAGIPVFYGLGNFHFYARGGAGSVTGVAEATIGPRGVVSTRWIPGRVSSGTPQLLTGSAARAASAAFAATCR